MPHTDGGNNVFDKDNPFDLPELREGDECPVCANASDWILDSEPRLTACPRCDQEWTTEWFTHWIKEKSKQVAKNQKALADMLDEKAAVMGPPIDRRGAIKHTRRKNARS